MNKSSGKQEAVVTLQVRADSSLSYDSGDGMYMSGRFSDQLNMGGKGRERQRVTPTFQVLVIEWLKVFCTKVDNT